MMKQESINLIIEATHSWVINENDEQVALTDIMQYATKVGIIPQATVATVPVLNYIKSKEINPNSTFYKTWEDVTSKTRSELLFDQLAHYASTYGTNFEEKPFIVNDTPVDIMYDTYTVIKGVPRDEMLDTLTGMIYSGIALKSDLVKAVCEGIFYLMKHTAELDINKVKNQEALCIIANELGVYPFDSAMATRVVWNQLTSKTQIIQSRKLYFDLVQSTMKGTALEVFKNFDENICTILASSYLRYKKMWHAVRKYCKTNGINDGVVAINRISNIANRYHKPMKVGFWESITTRDFTDRQLDYELSKLDNPFKVVKLLEMILLRKKQEQNGTSRFFNIRNGNIWFDSSNEKSVVVSDKLDKVEDTLITLLINKLTEARKKDNPEGLTMIKFPTDIELVLPSSHKTFYGNYPFGSYMNLNNGSVVGVYWKNSWGTRDFDLSFIDIDGNKTGWNKDYCRAGITYSGDMTTAENGASEMIRFDKDVANGVVYLNRFNGQQLSKFVTFVGSKSVDKCSRGSYSHKYEVGQGLDYMVNPNDIVIQADGCSYKQQQIIGLVNNSKLYMMMFNHTSSIVSKTSDVFASLCDKVTAHIPMKLIFEAAGYVTEETEENKDQITKVIDLTDTTSSAIIDLMKF